MKSRFTNRATALHTVGLAALGLKLIRPPGSAGFDVDLFRKRNARLAQLEAEAAITGCSGAEIEAALCEWEGGAL